MKRDRAARSRPCGQPPTPLRALRQPGAVRRTPLPPVLLNHPFLVRDAWGLGVSRDVLRSASFRRPFQGVRVPAHLPDTLEVRCRAAALLLPPDAAFSQATATALLGLPLPLAEATQRDSGVLEPERGAWSLPRAATHDARSPLHVTVPVRDPRIVGPRIAGIVTQVSKLDPKETQAQPPAVAERHRTPSGLGGGGVAGSRLHRGRRAGARPRKRCPLPRRWHNAGQPDGPSSTPSGGRNQRSRFIPNGASASSPAPRF
jgi:hypothetical protein